MIYDDLKTTISSYSARNDLGPQLDTFIALAEARFNRELRTPDQEKTAYYSDMDSEYVAVPDDFLSIKAMVRGSDKRTMEYLRPIDYRDFVDDDPWEGRLATDEGITPVWTFEDMQFRVYPYPTTSATLNVRILYFAKIPALSSTNTTNWLLADHPDIYVAQTAWEARMFTSATPAQIAAWKATADEGIASLRNQRRLSMTAKAMTTDIGIAEPFDIDSGWR